VLTAAAVGFGDQTVGTSASKPVTITNNGLASFVVNGISRPATTRSEPTDAPDSRSPPRAGTALCRSRSCRARWERVRTLTIADTVALGSHSVAQTGNGVEAPGSR
jgi:hypothetical protein